MASPVKGGFNVDIISTVSFQLGEEVRGYPSERNLKTWSCMYIMHPNFNSCVICYITITTLATPRSYDGTLTS